ncbi:F-box protein AUF2-like [Bidens hawaiensis]|uniref:F-box protein AUF2-like n=1 Tax=Bidens hawaiensis TaxID=980011 RepID=UPI00404B0829
MNTTEEDPSSLNRLPDELILQILTKQPDLKTLCFCHLVSKRFASIVLQLHTISFTAPLLNTNTGFWSLINGVVFKPIHLIRRMVLPSARPLPPIISSFYGHSFRSAVSFLTKFRNVKSLSIELPSSTHKGVNNSSLFKWKVSLGTRIESFVFLSPNSVSDTNCENIDQEQDLDFTDLFKRKVHIAFQCLKDVIVRHRMLLYFIKELPNLEKVLIMDSGKRGTVGLNGVRLDEVRGWVRSAPEDVKPEMNRIEVPVNVSQCYVPVLEMPVSGCVMKGVTFVVMRMNDVQDGDDCFVDGDDGFDDKVEAAYSEAVMEILEKHKDKMKRLL